MSELLEEMAANLEGFIPKIPPIDIFFEGVTTPFVFEGKEVSQLLLDSYTRLGDMGAPQNNYFLRVEFDRSRDLDEICKLKDKTSEDILDDLVSSSELDGLVQGAIDLTHSGSAVKQKVGNNIIRAVNQLIDRPEVDMVMYGYHKDRAYEFNKDGDYELALKFLDLASTASGCNRDLGGQYNLTVGYTYLTNDHKNLLELKQKLEGDLSLSKNKLFHAKTCARIAEFMFGMGDEISTSEGLDYLESAYEGLSELDSELQIDESDVSSTKSYLQNNKEDFLEELGQVCTARSGFREGDSKKKLLLKAASVFQRIVHETGEIEGLERVADTYREIAKMGDSVLYAEKARKLYTHLRDNSAHGIEKKFYNQKLKWLDSENP